MYNLTSEGFLITDSEKDLADNEWHQVDLNKKGTDTLHLYVDVKDKLINVPGFHSRTFAHQTFYLGGVDVRRIRSRHPSLSNRAFVPFEGCFDNDYVTVNSLLLLNLTRTGNATVHGRHITHCNVTPEEYYPITFKKPESFMKITVPSVSTAKYSFKFRTYDGEGILLFERITKDNGATIAVSLHKIGGIKLVVNFASKPAPVTVLCGSSLDDGMWHSVSIEISLRRVRLKVDSCESVNSQHLRGTFLSSSEVYVGANYQGKLGFIGCMRDFTVQGRKINLTNVYKSQIAQDDMGRCSLSDLCVPNPCQNGGRCSQPRNQTIQCDCSSTDFKGRKCETPSFFMQTCADWWAAGKTSNRYYKINPRNSKPFSVYCNMTNVDGPSTVILHSQDRKRIVAAQNNVDGKSYRHDIVYDTNDQNIKNLIATSTHCRQYLEYNCYNSVLFDSPKTFNLKSGRGARWVSRGGKLQDYWSGASRGSMKCACGMNGTCVERSKVCNCDTLDNNWHVDGGYLTDSMSLPVKRLIFSIDGTNKRSQYVLGSLECYGSTTKRTTTTNFPANETIITAQPSTKLQTKSPSTIATASTSGKHPATKTDRKRTTATTRSPPVGNDVSSTKPSSTTERNTLAATTPTDDTVQPGIVVIETPKKYITIRENANQELVLIILSVILAVFVIAIVVLLIKQNLFFPCKCLKVPLYHDVRHMDAIELGPPSPLYGETEPEPILQFEASPYPTRNYEIGSVHDCHITSSPELSDAETDRLDISNGSSSWISENVDVEKDKPEKHTEYEDIDLGLIDIVPSFNARKQLSTEEQIKKLKEVILDVLSASDVRANYSDRKENPANKLKPKDAVHSESGIERSQSQLPANEQFVDSDNDSTATISELSSDHELFNGDQCAKNYSYDKETHSDHDVCDESSKENTLENYKPAREKRINENSWISSDPHDNYLSLDVNHLEDDTLQRQPLSSALNGPDFKEQIPFEHDIMSPRVEIARYLPASCDERRRELRSLKDDKRKHSSPRSRLFSRPKSEEEALLSSTQANAMEERRSDRSSESNKRRYGGFSNNFYRQPHQQQNASAWENQPDRNNIRSRAIPLKQVHAQKYETEL